MKWLTFEKPQGSQTQSFYDAMAPDGFIAIMGTGGLEPAVRTQERGDPFLVDRDYPEYGSGHDG